MCLAVPVKVISLQGNDAEVESGGATYKANICLTPQAKVGDFVLLHTGYAISILAEDEAKQTLELFQELERVGNDSN
jgi:hydrogenase expression/formation protein HypC